jgi:hypothetical protein
LGDNAFIQLEFFLSVSWDASQFSNGETGRQQPAPVHATQQDYLFFSVERNRIFFNEVQCTHDYRPTSFDSKVERPADAFGQHTGRWTSLPAGGFWQRAIRVGLRPPFLFLRFYKFENPHAWTRANPICRTLTANPIYATGVK